MPLAPSYLPPSRGKLRKRPPPHSPERSYESVPQPPRRRQRYQRFDEEEDDDDELEPRRGRRRRLFKRRGLSDEWKRTTDSAASSPLSTIAPHRLADYRDQSPVPVAHRSRLKETLGLYKDTSRTSYSSQSSRSSYEREQARYDARQPPGRPLSGQHEHIERAQVPDVENAGPGSDSDFVMRPDARPAEHRDLRYYIEMFQLNQGRHVPEYPRYGEQRGFASRLRKLVRRRSRDPTMGVWGPTSATFFPYQHVEEVSTLMCYIEANRRRLGKGKLYYKEVIDADGSTRHWLKFKDPFRGSIKVCHRDCSEAARDMLRELSFEAANRNDTVFRPLFKLLKNKHRGAIILYKVVEDGLTSLCHVKVEHRTFTFRTCQPTFCLAVKQLVRIFSCEIARRNDRRFNKKQVLNEVIDASELIFPGSLVFYRKVRRRLWECSVQHPVEGTVAFSESAELDDAVESLSFGLTDAVEDLVRQGRFAGRFAY